MSEIERAVDAPCRTRDETINKRGIDRVTEREPPANREITLNCKFQADARNRSAAHHQPNLSEAVLILSDQVAISVVSG